jgi:predicted RNA methylase
MRKGIKNIYEFFETIGSLPELEGEILKYCYHEGRVTLQQLSNQFKKPLEEIKNAIKNLIEGGLIYHYRFQNIEFYELDVQTIKNIYYERFPAGPVIPLIYQFNLLSDSIRTDSLKKAIEMVVKPGDIVIDLGCGTGILSIFAAQRGAYVFAIEVDPLVADAAEYFIKNAGYSSKIKVIQGDARNLNLPLQADVIICEMLDTALIAELEVPVMNNAIKKWLKPDGKVIPLSASTSAELINIDSTFYGIDFRLIHYEEYGARLTTYSLSEPVIYHHVNFSEENPLEVSKKFILKTKRAGIANGLRIKTEVLLADGVKMGSSPWFNPPLILPFSDIPVTENASISVTLSYGLGAGFSSIKYDVKLIEKEE